MIEQFYDFGKAIKEIKLGDTLGVWGGTVLRGAGSKAGTEWRGASSVELGRAGSSLCQAEPVRRPPRSGQ